MLRLKFLTLKNLGSIARSRGDDSAALDAFIQVSRISLPRHPLFFLPARQWVWTAVR